MKRLSGIAAGSAIVLALAAIVSAGLAHQPGLGQRFGIIGSAEPCSSNHASLAVLARIKPGHSTAEVASAGYIVRPSNEPDLIVVWLGSSMPNVAQVVRYPAVLTAGILLAQTTEPTLRSCNYRLADNPRALALFVASEPAMEASGLITPGQISDASTIFLITDDPTNSAHLFLAAIKAVKRTDASPGSLTPVVATIDRVSHSVVHVGLGNWYP